MFFPPMSPAVNLLVTKGQNISLSLFFSSGVFRRTRCDKTHHNMNRRQPFPLQHYWTRRAKRHRLSSAESCWPFARLRKAARADACSARTCSVLLSLDTADRVASKILTASDGVLILWWPRYGIFPSGAMWKRDFFFCTLITEVEWNWNPGRLNEAGSQCAGWTFLTLTLLLPCETTGMIC